MIIQRSILILCCITIVWSIVALRSDAHWCDNWQAKVQVCQACQDFTGDLTLGITSFTFKEDGSTPGNVTRITSWTFLGVVIDDSEQVPRSDAELLYLIFEDLGENPCPVFQERLDIHWCGFANCVPNLPTWELKSSKFHYLANYDSEGLNTLAVWDVVSGEWLQTFFPIRLSALERTCEIVTKVNPFKEPMFIDAPNIACAPPTSGHVDPVSEPQDDTPPFAEPFLSTPPEASPKGEPPTSSPIVLPAQPHYRPDTHTVVPNGTPRSSRSSRGALIGGVVGGTVAALAVVLVASVLYHLVSERAEIEGAGPSQEIHENPLYEGPTTAYDNPLYTPNLEMQQLV